jgi:hypothetical protein
MTVGMHKFMECGLVKCRAVKTIDKQIADDKLDGFTVPDTFTVCNSRPSSFSRAIWRLSPA